MNDLSMDTMLERIVALAGRDATARPGGTRNPHHEACRHPEGDRHSLSIHDGQGAPEVRQFLCQFLTGHS